MKTLAELRQELSAASDLLKAAHQALEAAETEGRTDLEDLETAYTTARDECRALQKRVERAQEAADLEASLAAPTEPAPTPQPHRRSVVPAVHTREDRSYSLIALCRSYAAQDPSLAKVERRAAKGE